MVARAITIKEEEQDSDDEEEQQPMDVQIKKENSHEEIKRCYENVKDFSTINLKQLCNELDRSEGWKNLADLLDLRHFLEETVLFEKEPTKALLRLALVSKIKKF